MPKRSAVWMLLMGLCCAAPHAPAEQREARLDCDDPLHSGPAEIKRVLGTLYHAPARGAQLTAAAQELEQLVTAATYCRVRMQSPSSGASREMIAEWVMLHQWINRIADFVSLNASGEYRVDWKAEYADFASVYEFEV